MADVIKNARDDGRLDLQIRPMQLNIGPSHPATHATLRFVAELDGDACCRRVKDDPELCATPIVIVTTMGDAQAQERCRACGECVLGETGGICPITICAKNLLNGPCGGTNKGKCEVDEDKDCAWTLIYRRLEKHGL